jgi:hypothetical protein
LTDEKRRKVFARFKKRFGDSADQCNRCPGTDLKRLYPDDFPATGERDHYCVKLCGTVWPVLHHGRFYVDCPCHTWGPERASERLNQYLKPKPKKVKP